jgi:hypothetical protein
VGSGGCEVGVVGATERPEIMVGGMSTVKGEEGGAHAEGFGGETVDEMSGSGQGVRPVARGHGGLKQQGASDIVEGAEHTLGFAVLLGGVGTRHS